MMTISRVAAATAAFVLGVQPCAAADLNGHFTQTEQRIAAFAGVQVSLGMGQSRVAKPIARLQLSSAYYSRERSGAFAQTRRAPGLELGAGKAGRPTFFVAGQEAADVKKKLNLNGTTTTLLIVGGVVLALAVVAAASTPPQVDFDD